MNKKAVIYLLDFRKWFIWNLEKIWPQYEYLTLKLFSGDLVSPTPEPKLKRPRGGLKTTFSPPKPVTKPQPVEETLEVALSRGGISIITKRLVSDGSAMSTVTIENPTPAHSGKYACRPANLEPAYVNLHVIQGIRNYSGVVISTLVNVKNSKNLDYLVLMML